MEKNRIQSDLKGIFTSQPDIISVYLFGSTATGHQRKSSDADIAIYLEDAIPTELAGKIRLQMMDALENYFQKNTDVVMLNSASLKLIHQVLTTGVLIYTRDPERERAFALKKQKEYFDFKYYIDRDIHEMKAFFDS